MSKTAMKTSSKPTDMNEIRHMQRFLTRAFPTARITVDEPLVKGGVWSLDLFLPEYHLAVAWQNGKGFGIVSNDTHGYGEGADEVYEALENALPRSVELVTNRRPTAPPEAVRLKELREQRGLSQEEVARRLGSKQASISRAEARSDFLLSTLKKHAEALGATLVVKMVFPDCEKELKLEEAK
jgi:DNA-binding XRE family transcriptional regulator